MLKTLHIQNYALINNLNIKLDNGFVVMTGETGAGKSIILGALGLLLGERANLSSIGNKNKKCIVEGVFHISKYNLSSFFKHNDIDYDEETIIRRELSPNGKSRAFINDTPVNLNILKGLSIQLIDIHSQHQNLQIENENFQFKLIDSIAKNYPLIIDYQNNRKKYYLLKKEKENLCDTQQRQSRDLDYWQFQFDELKDIDLKEYEQEQLEEEHTLFSKSKEITEALAQSNSILNGDNDTPIDNLQLVINSFRQISSYYTPAQDLGDRLKSCEIELQDIAYEISKAIDKMQYDPERFEYVEARLNDIYRLQQKHNKTTIKELLSLQKELEDKLNSIQYFEDRLEKLDKDIKKAKQNLNTVADKLSKTRKKVIPKIENILNEKLQHLGIPYAKISIKLSPSETFRSSGKETISLLFSANKNTPPAEVSQIASGGELSRLMLCIKQLIAQSTMLPTLIFDEIDTGVSGKIADKVGQMMMDMTQKMQVICITHLPQIAASATQHWEVFKEHTSDKTQTSIEELKGDRRIKFIAKMLSGSTLTKEAIANAKSLIASSNSLI